MRVRALIFDFNGVIVNDEPLHCKAVQRTLAEDNLVLSTAEYYDRLLPFDDYNVFSKFLANRKEPGGEERMRNLIKRKAAHYFAQVREHIPVLPGSAAFLGSVPAGIPLAIASGAAKAEIEYILAELGLRSRFEEIIAAGDVRHSKPHPEAFLKAFDALRRRIPDLASQEVLVFEDSFLGIQGAHSAGFACVGIATSYPAERLSEAELVVETLDGWTVEKFESAILLPRDSLSPGGLEEPALE